jgi:hypothetical protein
MTVQLFKEQPTVEFPQWMKDLGFEDESHCGHASAFTLLQLADDHAVCAWVAEVDPRNRKSSSSSRYAIWSTRWLDDPDRVEDAIYKGDSDADASAAVRAHLDARRKPHTAHLEGEYMEKRKLSPELAALSAAEKLELAAKLVMESGIGALETVAMSLDEHGYNLRWEGIDWRTCPACQERDTSVPAEGVYTCEHCGETYTEDEY